MKNKYISKNALFMENVLLYVEELDGSYEAIIIPYTQWLSWNLRDIKNQQKSIVDDLPPIPLCIEKIDPTQYEDRFIINDNPKPLVPLKQNGIYSHKPKGVKRIYKTQQR